MIYHARIVCSLFLVVAFAPAICAGAAHAVDNTRYVSVTGSNANDCTRGSPCRALQRGINATPEGGELRILDSGSYGKRATINKSLTISGNGYTVTLGAAISIDDADAVVALRDLVLNGKGATANGINIIAAATAHIERCVIHGFADNGIVAAASGVKVFVLDSTSRDNGDNGIFAVGSRLTIDNSRFENNAGSGVSLSGSQAAIHRSTASGNDVNGISAFGGAVSVTSTIAAQNRFAGFRAFGTMMLESSVAHGNGSDGLIVGGGIFVRISNSTFTGNATGIDNSGLLESRQNNTVRGNTDDLAGSALLPIGGV